MSARSRTGYHGLSDIGHMRSVNEDSFVAHPPLYLVADGLGGHEAGEVASGIAAETLRQRAPNAADAASLAKAVAEANRRVIRAAEEGAGREGMGTTLTAAVVRGRRIAIAHVGDSRAYLLTGDGIERLTDDHSVVGDMVRSGTLTDEQARVHPSRSIITRALGTDGDMPVDTLEIVAEPGDRLLLCTDGLHGLLPDQDITRILEETVDPRAATRFLVEAALTAGGTDNVTAVVVDVSDEETAPSRIDSGSRRVAAFTLWVVAAVLAVAVGLVGTYSYARSRAFLRFEEGNVAVYRGVPGEFAGVSLKWLEQVTEIEAQDLPPVVAQRLDDGIRTDSLEEAMGLVAEYRELASEADTSTPGP